MTRQALPNLDLRPVSRSRKRAWLPLLLFGLFSILFVALALRGRLFLSSDNQVYDLFFRLRNRVHAPQPADNIIVVAIDDESMAEIGLRWPWPRAIHGDLVDALSKAGAAVIGFDVVFDVPAAEAEDATFAGAMGRAGNVVLAEDYAVSREGAFVQENWVRPIDRFLDVARGTGLALVERDPDGFLRRAALVKKDIPSR